MPGFGSISHWIILLVLVVLVFGTGKLRHAGRDIGEAISAFRRGVKDGEAEAKAAARLPDAGHGD